MTKTELTAILRRAGWFVEDPYAVSTLPEVLARKTVLALDVHLNVNYLTSGGTPRTKTMKQQQIDRAELFTLLGVWADDPEHPYGSTPVSAFVAFKEAYDSVLAPAVAS